MTKFYVDGINYHPHSDKALTILDKLPKNSYSLSFNDFTKQYFLQEIEEEFIKHKIYGDTEKTVGRVLNTFQDRSKSTGILLSGEKGCGKTLFAKLLSIKADVPTIIVNSPYCGENFNKFIQGIDQPCIIIFDEFEKVYDGEDQKMLLTILDGTYTTKKLFVLTCNDLYKIDSHMKNRPGRLYYHLKYDSINEDFVEEYASDNLLDQYKHQIKDLKSLPNMIRGFNFDMIKSIVEEINRYGDSVKDVLKFINIDIYSPERSEYIFILLDANKNVVDGRVRNAYFNPFTEPVEFIINGDSNDTDYDPDEVINEPLLVNGSTSSTSGSTKLKLEFNPTHIVSIGNNQNKITYNKDEYTLIAECTDFSGKTMLSSLF